KGVRKALHADNACYGHQLAENLAALVAEVGKGYTHVLGAHTTTGKNFLPRVAALLGVAQVSDIIGVVAPDTFKRPIYAGNGIATVRTKEPIKVVSVRGTGFDPVPATGGAGAVEPCAIVHALGLSTFISEEIAKSERPELTAARVVISGGRGM